MGTARRASNLRRNLPKPFVSIGKISLMMKARFRQMGYFDKYVNNGIPFMDGAEKGSLADLVGEPLHLDQFGFIHTKDYGEAAVVHFKEKPGMFYFANEILYNLLRGVADDGMEQLLAVSTITLSVRTSKSTGRDYIAFDIDEFKPAQ